MPSTGRELPRPADSEATEPLTQAATPADVCYNPDAVNRVYNPAKAKQLLAEAGFASGFKSELAVQASLEQNIDTATLIQSYLAAVNINVDIDPLDTAKWSSYADPGGQGWTNSFSYGITGVNAKLPGLCSLDAGQYLCSHSQRLVSDASALIPGLDRPV